jgi:hypothetical protein
MKNKLFDLGLPAVDALIPHCHLHGSSFSLPQATAASSLILGTQTGIWRIIKIGFRFIL